MPALPGLSADCEQLILRSNEHHAIRNGRRSHQRLADSIRARMLELRTSLHNEDVSVLARQIDPSIGSHRRCAEAAALMRDAFEVLLLTGRQIVTSQDALVLQNVKVSLIS